MRHYEFFAKYRGKLIRKGVVAARDRKQALSRAREIYRSAQLGNLIKDIGAYRRHLYLNG